MAKSAGAVVTWRKSSYSSANGGCVEVAWVEGVLVRDSKQADGPVLAVGVGQWRAFLGTVG